MTVDELAREFGHSPAEVAAWDAGLDQAPVPVIRTLEILSAFGAPEASGGRRIASRSSYTTDVDPGHRKRFGQVFTPPAVAALMADWVAAGQARTVLDLGLGTGHLAQAVLARLPDASITGVEVDSIVLEYLDEALRDRLEIVRADALTWRSERTFDGIIMNPPYIRHRELKGHERVREEVSLASFPIPKSANLYVDFVAKACSMLAPGGRGAFLIPAEWMSANFSTGLKTYLLDRNLLRGLVTFSHCSQVFDGALTTASVLLVENGGSMDSVSSHFLQSVGADKTPTSLADLRRSFPARDIAVERLRQAAKWEPLLRGDQLEMPEGWTSLGELAQTRRGIATGSNGFFLISERRRRELEIQAGHAKPCVGRANDVLGLVFETGDFEELRDDGANVWLLDFTRNLTDAETRYIQAGEAEGLPKRYLLKCRSPWFSMEKCDPAPIWAGVFGRGDLRFVHNVAGVRSLTNFHCVVPRFAGATRHKALVALLNCREVRDLMAAHRRGYGGGLGKFEPNDLKAIPIPDIRYVSDDVVETLAGHLARMDREERAGGSALSLAGLIEQIQTQVKAAAAGRLF